jgi:hypothetical protein
MTETKPKLLATAGKGRPSSRKEKALKAVREDVNAEKMKRFNVDIPEALHTFMPFSDLNLSLLI